MIRCGRPVFRALNNLSVVRNLCSVQTSINPDLPYLLSPANRTKIIENVTKRLSVSTPEATQMLDNLVSLKREGVHQPSEENRAKLINQAEKFPNMTHPNVADLQDPVPIYFSEDWKPRSELKQVRPFEDIARALGYPVRTQNTGQISTEKSYFLYNKIAELEQALIRYTVDHLVKRHGYRLMSVPDLLHPDVIRRCGMTVDGNISQVFKLDPRYCGEVALSGTAEMAFGGFFMDKKIEFKNAGKGNRYEEIRKYVAVSRCYRAESSKGQKERGIYRVHHFTKVEMFGLMPGSLDLSNLALEQFLDVQKQLFEGLGLHFKVLDMPPHELGNPAYRKYDIEALYPGRKAKVSKQEIDGEFYGEISSCSNCTDYQSRRLNIRDERGQFVHTINGTACAVPRMIMAILEQNQTATAAVKVPEKLQKYMRGITQMEPLAKKARNVQIYIRSPKAIKAKYCQENNKS